MSTFFRAEQRAPASGVLRFTFPVSNLRLDGEPVGRFAGQDDAAAIRRQRDWSDPVKRAAYLREDAARMREVRGSVRQSASRVLREEAQQAAMSAGIRGRISVRAAIAARPPVEWSDLTPAQRIAARKDLAAGVQRSYELRRHNRQRIRDAAAREDLARDLAIRGQVRR